MLIDNDAKLDLADKDEESTWLYLCEFNSAQFRKYEHQFIQRIYIKSYLCPQREYFSRLDLLWYFEKYKQDGCMVDAFRELDDLSFEYRQNENESILKTRKTKMIELEHRFEDHLIDCHKRCLQKLAEKSNWVDKANKKGETPLLRAFRRQSDKWIIELLIRKRPNMQQRDGDGNTALYLALNEDFDSNLCKLLIQNGANLHGKYGGKRVFDLVCEKSLKGKNGQKLKIYRNALIQELSDTFKYTDYDVFKQRVIESIQDENVILVDSDHLKALNQLGSDVKWVEEAIVNLKSLQFQERLIVDYLNVLKDHIELLEIRNKKIISSLPEISNKISDNKNWEKNSNYFKLRELISEKTCEDLIDLTESKERQIDQLTKMSESCAKYISIVKDKVDIGCKLQEFVETKLSFH
jgi:ankyrin repeat protein